ncbi:hypothetical protein SFUMM280S_00117 [Streptomyces fumanus]
MPDAVVIGAGPNGLVAANLLADAGWDVHVLEEQPEPGGAVRHDDQVAPGFVNDLFSSFYPLAAASPVLAGLRLQDHGLRWSHAPHVLAHPLTDGTCAVLDRDVRTTAASLDAFAPGDGRSWHRLHDVWNATGGTSWTPCSRRSRRSGPPPGWPPGCAAGAGCGWPAPWCCRCAAWARRSSGARAAG